MSEGDEKTPIPDRSAQAEPAIGDPPSGKRREVYRHRIDADDRARRFSLESKAALSQRRGHEEDKERPDPVEREPLPHLREEQRREPKRLPEEAAILRIRR